jgi:FlaA1/EpsC-like NDP-sugar epimerase
MSVSDNVSMAKNDERTILVTGATGTVGSEVVKQTIFSKTSMSGTLSRKD